MEGRFGIRPSVCFEVQKITAVSIGEGNQRNYQVQWAPTWISGVHLVGCEHLIEEFLCLQSEKGQEVDDVVSPDMTNTHGLQNDLRDNLLVGNSVPALRCRQQLTEEINKQGSMVANNSNSDHLSENSSTTPKDHVNLMDNVMSKSGCQITDMYEGGRQTSPNFERAERIIEGINIDEDVGENVTNDVYDEINTAANTKEAADVFILDGQDVNSLLHGAMQGAESNREFPNVSDIKREEIEVDAIEPNTLSSKYTRIKHKSLNKLQKKWECNICHKVLKNNHGLSQHLSKIHGITKKWWVCDLCHIRRDSEARLLQHKCKHTVPHCPLKCSYCGKVCHLRSILIRHLRVHTNERPYGCKVCNQTFKIKDHLERHTYRKHRPK